MTRFIKILLPLLVLVTGKLQAQTNIFDCENSQNFAQYLFNTNQFELAQHELERISYFCEFDSASQLILLKSYRKIKKYQPANAFFLGKSINEIGTLNPEFKTEYIRLQMTQHNYDVVKQSISNGLDFTEKKEHLLGIALVQQNWEEAYKLSSEYNAISNYKINGLKQIANESYLAKRKKPWVATLLSVVLPGSGKMYSGYWGDGVISLLFTASSSFFAYRAFNKYGTDKVYPYLIGGLAASYYVANIYGGNRAAIYYNDNLNHGFIHETERILYSDY